ncbi:MAG: DoxX family protein [Vampirovibrionales bacterium]|nr:DoxX family protein [Vampirovibrionales bacterium]
MMLNQIARLQQTLCGYAPLFIRLPLGIIMIAHGMDKAFGTFHGGGFAETVKGFAEMGMQPATVTAGLAVLGELGGGILVLLGLLTPIGAFLIAATMAVAVFAVHFSAGLFAQDGGYEYPLALLGAALSLMFSGGGKCSIDALLMGKNACANHYDSSGVCSL